MLRSVIAVAALAGSLLFASSARAQVDIKVPFVRVSTGGPGGGVFVKAPLVTVDVPPKYPAYYQAPVYTQPVYPGQQLQPKPFMPPSNTQFFQGQQPDVVFPPQQNGVVIPQQQPGVIVQPQQPPIVLPSPGVVVGQKAVLTHKEFAKIFVPVAGTYNVTLIHPGSGCPVDVCFTLPPGCPKVCVGHRYIEFDYGKCEVEIRFALFGKVRVEYND